MSDYISRTLIVDERTFTEEELLQQGRVFVVLAEPGAGKTELLKRFAELLKTVRQKASIFRHQDHTRGTSPFVIDAMDEVARIDTLATDAIIAQVAVATTGIVIFAGRSGEWDNGRTAHVRNAFKLEPKLVRLQPFNDAEQRKLFVADFPGEDFDAFVQEVWRFELGPLLGNPQFLQLLGSAYLESQGEFTSKAKIFSDAVRRLVHEANREVPRDRRKRTIEQIIAFGSEVFAKLLLSGSSGIATVEQWGDRNFPYINGLLAAEEDPSFLMDTRLFKPSDDADKHEPVHRIVAEYCAASYLVKRVETSADRLSLERVLSIVAPNGVIRDDLRGMLGWMAALGSEPIQLSTVRLDPYAILANGDPSQLRPKAKRLLLSELDRLAEIDPMFRRSDHWREFNVGLFFSSELVDAVRAVFQKEGSLRGLLLEMLIGNPAASSFTDCLSVLMTNAAAGESERSLAADALLTVNTYDPTADFATLLAEQTYTSLQLASRLVEKRGPKVFGANRVAGLLARLSALYPVFYHQDRGMRPLYFVKRLTHLFDVEDLSLFLDILSTSLECTCDATHDYQCNCRDGKSKIIGNLVDRYFEQFQGPHDPVKLWSWIRGLQFQSSVSADRSAAVKFLREDHGLRHKLQQMMMNGVSGDEAAVQAVGRLYSSRTHAGLIMQDDDREALSDYAYQHEMIHLWAALYVGHDLWNASKRSSPLRAKQRVQSRSSRDFRSVWWERERSHRILVQNERRSNHVRRLRGHVDDKTNRVESNRTYLRDNLVQIEAGQHWVFLRKFMRSYLFRPNDLTNEVDDPETPLRALRNCFSFLHQHIPTLETLARREPTVIAETLLAACLLKFREGDDLSRVDPRILEAVKATISSFPSMEDGEEEAFEAAIDAAIFTTPSAAESYIRRFIEQQLSSADEAPVNTYWLDKKAAFQPLRSTVPLEWLERFPCMPYEASRSLFAMASKYGDKKNLLALITRRLGDPVIDSGLNTDADKWARRRKTFWQLNAFFYQALGWEDAWKELKTDPRTVLAISERLGRFLRDDEERPRITAGQVFEILDAFVTVWPKVPLPNSFGTGDPDDETAYRFLLDCIWLVNDDKPEQRVPVLDKVIANAKFADFREFALTLKAEATREIARQDVRAPSPSEITRFLDDHQIATVEDLRALMVEELGELQKWLKGAETNPVEAYYACGMRVDENTARNRIVERLQGRMSALGLSVVIERHMAGGNRCDITATANLDGTNLLLVTEVKGQWNKDLYTAASAQLAERYAVHPDAAQQGVYLVLWYGTDEKIANAVDPSISTEEELKDRIIAFMPQELRNRVNVVVLDLTRPTPVEKQPKDIKKASAKSV